MEEICNCFLSNGYIYLYMNINYEKIKLIIWDLDECFWKGTLSEGTIELPTKNKELIIQLSNRGIVNSICSKNDEGIVKTELEKLGLCDYFVFISVNWDPKGLRIRRIIDSMNLRAENVLFIDDNISNLKEAEFYCAGIMTSLPECIDELIIKVDFIGKNDSNLSRLTQYRQLEQKDAAKSNYSSNEEFLYASNIRVDICTDVENEESRLYELVLRTNQLNFTKKRDTPEEFHELILDPEIKKGYVSARDKFGDYGIIGFYSVKGNKLYHFLFSCRTMGMGIEQYVYAMLGYPEIEIHEPVSGSLETDLCPKWINCKDADYKESAVFGIISSSKAIVKGPCDLGGVVEYLRSDAIETELYYVNDFNRQVEIQCATQNIVNCRLLTNADKHYLSGIMPFYEADVFMTKIYDPTYKIVIISIVPDFNFGVYRHKSKNIKVALGQNYKDITDPVNWEGYINGEIFNSNYALNKAQLERFAMDFYKVPYSAKDIIENINYILNNISKDAKLVIMLGSELESPKLKHEGNYKNRAKLHRAANEVIKAAFKNNSRVYLIEPSKYIKSENDYHDNNINHYSKRVLYYLAEDICNILNGFGIDSIRTSTKRVIINKIIKRLNPAGLLASRKRA